MATGNDIGTDIKRKASELGFEACGFAAATAVSSEAAARYDRWIADGRNDEMQWAARNCDVRNDPRLLLDGARTVISVAMGYYQAHTQPPGAMRVAMYALGSEDYHTAVKRRLFEIAQLIADRTGCVSRCFTDSAPLRERYWAQQAGIGFVGRNNTLIIPGKGSYFFLGEIVTTLALPPDEPCRLTCGECGECVSRCPTGALNDGNMAADARLCLSCLTIEHRSDLPPWVEAAIGDHAYGCDECQLCCPHNRHARQCTAPELQPSDTVMQLTPASVLAMTPADYRHAFAHSAIKRARLDMLQRNCRLAQPKRKQ